MSFLNRLLGIESRGADYTVTPADVFGIGLDQVGSATKAGIRVTDETALAIPTAYRCINLLADTISSQNCAAYVKQDGVFVPSGSDPGFLDFNAGFYTKSQVIGAMVSSIAMLGNSYTATYRDGEGQIVWLEPLDPERIKPYRDGPNKYFTVEGERFVDGKLVTEFDVLHIPGLLLAGNLEGISPTKVLKDAIALTVAATEYGAGFFGNSAIPGAIVETEGEMSPAGKRAARREWEQMHNGAGNAKKIGFLTQGAKFKTISIPPNEAQFLQTREFQVPEIARMYGVPPTLLGHSDNADMGKSIEDKAHQFNQYTLNGWFTRIQEGLTKLHRSEMNDQTSVIRFDREELEQGNFTTFTENLSKLVKDGIITINEARRRLGKGPVPWGDTPISVQVQDDTNEEVETDDDNGA